MSHIVFIGALVLSCFTYSTTATTTTQKAQSTEADFVSEFLSFSIGGIPVIITLSAFFCIACVAGNCSLWWYFKHVKRENTELMKENKDLERQVSGQMSPELEILNTMRKPKKLSDEYYDNVNENDSGVDNMGERVFSLSVIHEDDDDDLEDETELIEETSVEESEYKHTEIHQHITTNKHNINIFKTVIADIVNNINTAYNSRAQIPDLCHARRDKCNMNDLWKEIDKLKAIIYWYDSAMRGHLLFCDAQYTKVMDNKQDRIKLSDVTSHMSLPERNMYIIEIHKNDQNALKQENYLNLMQKISSLNDIMHEEEKMCSPRYDLYEKFRCSKCKNTKTGLDEILIFEECYHFYCMDCLKQMFLKKQMTICPFKGCSSILSKYEILQIKKRITDDKKQQKMFLFTQQMDDEKVYDTEPKKYRGLSCTSQSGSSARSFGKLYSIDFRETISVEYAQILNKLSAMKPQMDGNKAKLVDFVNNNIYGKNELFTSAFGVRPVIYCDWMSSGKPLKCCERYINLEVLTMYSANRRSSSSSITIMQTNKFINESKSIILRSIGGNIRNDAIVFTGTGSTDAIYKMAKILLSNRNDGVGYHRYNGTSTIVFVSIYEKESNVYIWKELGCTVIVIPEDKDNGIGIDISILERHLAVYTEREMKTKYNLLIGSFTAASNVCGIIMKHDEIADKLHAYGALSFWDFGCAAPYVDINMDNKDAVFISTHRFIGGVGSVGILCAKKHLFVNYIPVIAASGTLFYSYGAEDGQYQYIDNIEEREEGSTLHIAGCIRSALSFMIKDCISTSFIQLKHEYNLNYFIKQCGSIKNLKIIGYTRNKSIKHRLPIISFEIKYKNKYLHYNFVSALMNDLFGIQGYGGSGSAGMYCKYSLNLTDDEMKHMIKQMSEYKNELSRPGYYQLYLHFTLTKHELIYITNTVKYICNHGWKFLPLYSFDIHSGNYYHRAFGEYNRRKELLRSLLDVDIDETSGKLCWKDNHSRFKSEELEKNLNAYFELANNALNDLKRLLPTREVIRSEKKVKDKHSWYWLPSEMFPYVVEYAFQDVIVQKHNHQQRRDGPKRKYTD